MRLGNDTSHGGRGDNSPRNRAPSAMQPFSKKRQSRCFDTLSPRPGGRGPRYGGSAGGAARGGGPVDALPGQAGGIAREGPVTPVGDGGLRVDGPEEGGELRRRLGHGGLQQPVQVGVAPGRGGVGVLLQGDALGGRDGEHPAHRADHPPPHPAVGAGQEAGVEVHGLVGPAHLVGGGVDEGHGGRLPHRPVGGALRQVGLLRGVQPVPLHEHPVVLPLDGHVGDGPVGGPAVHIAVAGAVQGQVAEEARPVAGGHGHAVLDGLAEALRRGQGGGAVHPHPLPPHTVGADGVVEKQGVRAQAAQVEGLLLPADAPGQVQGQLRENLVAEFQVRVIVGHDCVNASLSM